MTWQLALAVAAALFGVFIVWRVRPTFGRPKVGKARRRAFEEARARVLSATSPAERALALCDAGDARASLPGSPASALAYYLRAVRTDPASVEPVTRAARALARRPRVLESFLWRRLAGAPWAGEQRSAAMAALHELERVYASSRKNRTRAHAIANALSALGEPPRTPEPARVSNRPRRAATVDQG